eukprot:Rhum_TRINITY_DN4361_c0_g1::Rhum_TRINITY_DN4361_c0_g1_i1::g.14028::m.14028
MVAPMSGAAATTDEALVVPEMPLFSPSTDKANKEVFQRFMAQDKPGGKDFSFPADRLFWNNFLAESSNDPASTAHPWLKVQASHADGEHFLSTVWVQGYVRAWETLHPHLVTVRSANGTRSFHASHEFWWRTLRALDERAAQRKRSLGGGDLGLQMVTITCEHPHNSPATITAAADDWANACRSWEAEKGCTRDELLRQIDAKKLAFKNASPTGAAAAPSAAATAAAAGRAGSVSSVATA